jgi:hypothetical protein
LVQKDARTRERELHKTGIEKNSSWGEGSNCTTTSFRGDDGVRGCCGTTRKVFKGGLGINHRRMNNWLYCRYEGLKKEKTRDIEWSATKTKWIMCSNGGEHMG